MIGSALSGTFLNKSQEDVPWLTAWHFQDPHCFPLFETQFISAFLSPLWKDLYLQAILSAIPSPDAPVYWQWDPQSIWGINEQVSEWKSPEALNVRLQPWHSVPLGPQWGPCSVRWREKACQIYRLHGSELTAWSLCPNRALCQFSNFIWIGSYWAYFLCVSSFTQCHTLFPDWSRGYQHLLLIIH